MGLTAQSIKNDIIDIDTVTNSEGCKVIALAGNPNVGKSTVFNALTGLNQHTGNWPGKTVSNAVGRYKFNNEEFSLVDIPGTYSLSANSAEEEIARDFICFSGADAVIVVVDATALQKNLNLVLQILEVTTNVIVCVNLIDEANKKGIKVDYDELSLQLGVPVVPVCARNGTGLDELIRTVSNVTNGITKTFYIKRDYPEKIEQLILEVIPIIENIKIPVSKRWTALKLLTEESDFLKSYDQNCYEIQKQVNIIKNNCKCENIEDVVVETLINESDNIYYKCVSSCEIRKRNGNKLDKILTGKKTGIPIMLFMLLVVFWITIEGANYPSQWLSSFFGWFEGVLTGFLEFLRLPDIITGLLIDGIYKTVTFIVSVMLPPMAIFFPIFTLLEDSGFLPRIAFNMDYLFKKCDAHGKQSLTMCMGFGCNVCGVIGSRIIDSKRERLIAIITNTFVPCNGRFPSLIALITMFFTIGIVAPFDSFFCAVILVGVIMLGVGLTCISSKLLSKTILHGEPSSFVLELPPYRKPQIVKVIVRSIFDRTLFVLGRAVTVAIPAGIVIYALSNITIDGSSLFRVISDFLNPLGTVLGLDGVILLAFIIGFPANEIIIPIMLMGYLSTNTIADYSSYEQLKLILLNNNWTICTAIATIIFFMFHFPCATTLWTIKKETNSMKYTMVSFLMPLCAGVLLCMLTTLIFNVFVY